MPYRRMVKSPNDLSYFKSILCIMIGTRYGFPSILYQGFVEVL